jgi:hypothetical protein
MTQLFSKVTLWHEIKMAVYVHVHILYEILLFIKGTRKSWMHDLQERCFMSCHVRVYVKEDRFPATQMAVSSFGQVLNLRTPTSGQWHAPGFLATLWNLHIKSISHRYVHLVTSRPYQVQYWQRHSRFLVSKSPNFLSVLNKKILPKNTHLQTEICFIKQ